MNHYIKARTNRINCEGSAAQLQQLEEMFPLHAVDDDDILEALDKYFNPGDQQHVRFLQQACFKTPLADVARVYEDFRLRKHAAITEPLISDYFSNEHFLSLRRVEKWLDGLATYPSLASPDNLRDEIAQALLTISEQFGYIPNLQRFLLYYPNYLIKVLKFKNRYFEERVEETCEVTYLSPKNCCFAGIIAAIEVGSPYMIARMVNMFLVRGGAPAWITDKKYPDQFKPLFGLFRKIAIAPWSLNETDLVFGVTNWDKEVYFDLITAGIFVMTMSTISLAMGLKPDEPCSLIPLDKMLEIKAKYDIQTYETLPNKLELEQQFRRITEHNKQFSKEQIQEMEGKRVEPYMKEIGTKLSTQDLHKSMNSLFTFLGIAGHYPINVKLKDNSFFYRYRDMIDKGLDEQRKSGKISENKFECFRSCCIEGSTMTFENFGRNSQNTRFFRKCIQVLAENLCGYINEGFDYKKNIKLNGELTMSLKFYVRLLSLSPLYVNKQVLMEVNHERGKGWIECFDLGHLAVLVAETKAKLLMTSIQAELYK